MQVKLAEGGLGGPRKEDVHWLDWHQLKVSLLFLVNFLPVDLLVFLIFFFSSRTRSLIRFARCANE
jgi:hypothetical protein